MPRRSAQLESDVTGEYNKLLDEHQACDLLENFFMFREIFSHFQYTHQDKSILARAFSMGYSNKSLAYKHDALILVFVYTLDVLTHHIALHRMQFELE